jgi:hypothetical protein
LRIIIPHFAKKSQKKLKVFFRSCVIIFQNLWKNSKGGENMTKFCPFINELYRRDCSIFNENTGACTIPLMNINMYKLRLSNERLEDKLNDVLNELHNQTVEEGIL